MVAVGAKLAGLQAVGRRRRSRPSQRRTRQMTFFFDLDVVCDGFKSFLPGNKWPCLLAPSRRKGWALVEIGKCFDFRKCESKNPFTFRLMFADCEVTSGVGF